MYDLRLRPLRIRLFEHGKVGFQGLAQMRNREIDKEAYFQG
jgi:hypothetical protein